MSYRLIIFLAKNDFSLNKFHLVRYKNALAEVKPLPEHLANFSALLRTFVMVWAPVTDSDTRCSPSAFDLEFFQGSIAIDIRTF